MIALHRFYHLSNVTYRFKKQGIKLCKMVNLINKKHWHPTHQFEAASVPTPKSLTNVKHEPDESGQRRSAMLNKVFMKKITDLMSTGTGALNTVGRGIEISKVSITQDFNTLNVFWVCKGNASDTETEKVLQKAAGPLRYELSTLRFMREIPFIEFVKDKQEAQIVEMDRCSAIADHDEDYTLAAMGSLLKSEFTLNTNLSREVKIHQKKIHRQVLQLAEEGSDDAVEASKEYYEEDYESDDEESFTYYVGPPELTKINDRQFK